MDVSVFVISFLVSLLLGVYRISRFAQPSGTNFENVCTTLTFDSGEDKRGIIIIVYAGTHEGYSDHTALAQYEYGQAGRRTEIFP